ncbi:hypothetical protein RvY_06574 [Ramazzottius varieornatus]|uniref:Uncharacterized protein n=1 Tax=Ramazzottius varieornatus TaxID=947166 RepID=A0A1D1V8M6_RAMVA|nr:hypothetical protein RvY_06574 [Ramazzottius varieornatus]
MAMMLPQTILRAVTSMRSGAAGYRPKRNFAVHAGLLYSSGNSVPTSQIQKTVNTKIQIDVPNFTHKTELVQEHAAQQHEMEVMEELSHAEPKDPIELAHETHRSGSIVFEEGKDEASLQEQQAKSGKKVDYFKDQSTDKKKST